MATAVTNKTTQDFVPIEEIRSGVVIMKDKSLRAIMMVSSLNFSLKSTSEQEAIIMQFQNFLNSLDFSVQIFMQSRRLDIRPYLLTMEEKYREQTDDLIRIQTREYIEFIKSFTESVNIMSKSFFVVIPYTPSIIKTGGFFKAKSKNGEAVGKYADDFEENRLQLEQRVGIVDQGLSGSGLRTVRLDTEEIVELYYKLFNPGETGKPMQRSQ